MKVVIVGCGKLGVHLTSLLEESGHKVAILDLDARSFRFLPPGFKGTTVVGNGIEDGSLRQVGAGEAEALVAVTDNDNVNIMTAQIAKHIFNVPKAFCRIYDPARERIFAELGLLTMSPATAEAWLIKEALGA